MKIRIEGIDEMEYTREPKPIDPYYVRPDSKVCDICYDATEDGDRIEFDFGAEIYHSRCYWEAQRPPEPLGLFAASEQHIPPPLDDPRNDSEAAEALARHYYKKNGGTDWESEKKRRKQREYCEKLTKALRFIRFSPRKNGQSALLKRLLGEDSVILRPDGTRHFIEGEA